MVELMVASSIALVVFAVGFTAMLRFSRVHYSLATQADLDRDFRYAINWITDDIRGLQSIEIEELTDEEIENGEIPKVTIFLPSIRNANGVQPATTKVIYLVGDDQVLRRQYAEFSSSGQLLNNKSTRLLEGVTDMQFDRVFGTSSFDLTITSSRQAGGQAYEKNLTTRVASRN